VFEELDVFFILADWLQLCMDFFNGALLHDLLSNLSRHGK
jgi:hypothetical protein